MPASLPRAGAAAGGMPYAAGAGAAPAGDMYLLVQTKRAGRLKGEVVAEGHEDEIRVHSWRWSVAASAAIGSTRRTARRSYSGLTVVKWVDSATTGLMAALATNDEVKEARLTMRKAGGDQIDYFIVTLGNARVGDIEHAADEGGTVLESVTFEFTKVSVEYRTQKATGVRGGSYSFEDEILPEA
jgi:type VI secretion system secreted protein Hcp